MTPPRGKHWSKSQISSPPVPPSHRLPKSHQPYRLLPIHRQPRAEHCKAPVQECRSRSQSQGPRSDHFISSRQRGLEPPPASAPPVASRIPNTTAFNTQQSGSRRPRRHNRSDNQHRGNSAEHTAHDKDRSGFRLHQRQIMAAWGEAMPRLLDVRVTGFGANKLRDREGRVQRARRQEGAEVQPVGVRARARSRPSADCSDYVSGGGGQERAGRGCHETDLSKQRKLPCTSTAVLVHCLCSGGCYEI